MGKVNTSYDHFWSKLNISGKTQHLIRPLFRLGNLNTSAYNHCFNKLSINSTHHTTTIGLNLISVGKLNRTSYDHYCPKLNISRKNSTQHHILPQFVCVCVGGKGGDSTHHTTIIGLNLILVGKHNKTWYDHYCPKLTISRKNSTQHHATTVSLNLGLSGEKLSTSYDHYWSKLNISGKTQQNISWR